MALKQFEPRSLLVVPEQFGKKRDARWIIPEDARNRFDPRLGAAYWQHLVVYRALPLVDQIFHGKVSEFAEELGLADATGLRKKLRGERPGQMEDYVSWARVLGRGIIPDRYDDFPAKDRSDLFVPSKYHAGAAKGHRASRQSAGRS